MRNWPLSGQANSRSACLPTWRRVKPAKISFTPRRWPTLREGHQGEERVHHSFDQARWLESDLRTHIGSTAEAMSATRAHDQSIDQRGTAGGDHHLEVDAMHTRPITTSSRSPLNAQMVRTAGDYDAATLEALRAFLADLAWSDQGE